MGEENKVDGTSPAAQDRPSMSEPPKPPANESVTRDGFPAKPANDWATLIRDKSERRLGG